VSTNDQKRTSKFLSLLLRHRPELIGIRLDHSGWVDIDDLLDAMKRHGRALHREDLMEIVKADLKGRYAIVGNRIRANQGHSVEVDLGLEPVEPPEHLYHGTVERFLPAIRDQGLVKGQRHHVHLSEDAATATAVGSRRGKAVVLVIEAGRMHRDRHTFYQSHNGVWLTNNVAPRYIVFPGRDRTP
jgi:putative RNA 2'-phosphotransferase